MPRDQAAFSPGEVAGRCGVSVKVVRSAIRSGELRAFKFGARVIRVPREAVEAWLDQSRERARGRKVLSGA